jgi:hypothetical protein
MNLLARTRHVLARHPWLYWLVVVVLAALAGVAVTRATAEVDAARRAWGEERTVYVARVEVAPGDALTGALEARPLPSAMVPADAVDEIDAAAAARHRIGVGEVVVAHDVVATAGPQPLIPEGWQGVAVSEAVPSGVAVGDRVAASSGGVVLADEGLVVAQPGGDGGPAVLVAVPADAAPQVAHAAGTGELALLVLP